MEIRFLSAGRAKSVAGSRDSSGGEQRLSSSIRPAKRSIWGCFSASLSYEFHTSPTLVTLETSDRDFQAIQKVASVDVLLI